MLEVVPLVGAATALAAGGARRLRALLMSPTGYVLVGLLCALAFLALLAFGDMPGWNVVFLGCFSVLVGTVLGLVFPLSEPGWGPMAESAILSAVGGGAGGAWLGPRLDGLSKPLWWSAGIYLAGIVLISAGRAGQAMVETLGWAGVTVFAGLVAVRAGRCRHGRSSASSPVEAGAMLMLLANLLLAAGLGTGRLVPWAA